MISYISQTIDTSLNSPNPSFSNSTSHYLIMRSRSLLPHGLCIFFHRRSHPQQLPSKRTRRNNVSNEQTHTPRIANQIPISWKINFWIFLWTITTKIQFPIIKQQSYLHHERKYDIKHIWTLETQIEPRNSTNIDRE
jgi:hypothetical protein